MPAGNLAHCLLSPICAFENLSRSLIHNTKLPFKAAAAGDESEIVLKIFLQLYVFFSFSDMLDNGVTPERNWALHILIRSYDLGESAVNTMG